MASCSGISSTDTQLVTNQMALLRAQSSEALRHVQWYTRTL